MSDDPDFEMDIVDDDELDEMGADDASDSSELSHSGMERDTTSRDIEEGDSSSFSDGDPNFGESAEVKNGDLSSGTGNEEFPDRNTTAEWGVLGRPPEEWGTEYLAEKFDVIKDSVDPSGYSEDEEILLYSMPAYDEGKEPVRVEAGSIGSKKFKVPSHTLLFPKLNITKKRFWLVRKGYDKLSLCSTEYWPLVQKDELNLEYYHQLFGADAFVNKPRLSTSATTNSHQRIKSNLFEKVRLPVPPLPEQRKIASVLYTVDQAIQKTEAIIEQAQRVKRGVTQKVLKGESIDSDKKVEKFRVGPELKRLPSNWQVRPLGEIAEVSGGKRLPKDHGYADKTTDHPYLRVTDMKDGGIESDELEYLREETHQEISKYTISSKDIYISIAGTIGVTGVIPEELDGANLTENAAKIHGLKSVNRDYLALYLQSKLGQDEIFRMTVGSSQPKLSLFRIKLIDVVLPPADVQEEIASAVESFRDKIASEQKTASRLYTLKKGLMQDLLTGEICTADKAIEVLDEVAAHG